MSIPFKFNPLGISGKFSKPLRLTATQDSSSVKLTKTGSPNVSGLKYRLSSSDPWSTYTIDTVIDLDKDEYVEFFNSIDSLSLSYNDYVQFVMTGKIAASGNIQSLLNYSDSCHVSCYNALFVGCTSLIKAPELPSTKLADRCYFQMFYGCSSLIQAPKLPSIILANNCYRSMFAYCTSLTSAPALPATSLMDWCYAYMFNNCTSLVNAPNLPATTLATNCYNSMFRSCTSLRSAPELPATTLATSCYQAMFQNCTGLIVGPTMNATTLATNSCVTMFSGCTLLQSITVKFSDWGFGTATTNWLQNVAQIGTFTKPGGLPESRGASYIPTGWTIANSYKRDLAYLESTGTQYINTDIKPDFANGDSIELHYYGPDAQSVVATFGSRGTNVTNGVYQAGSNIVFCDSNGYTAVPFNYRNEHTLSINNVNIVDNGNILATVPRQVTSAKNIYLFAFNSNETISNYYSGMKLYEWKYYKNGVLAQHLIPVMNNDDVPCLYDKVTATFKYNAGTGQFNYGEL